MSQNRRVRWGILGYAKIAREQMMGAMLRSSHAELFALASRDAEKREQCAARYPTVKLIESYDDLLRNPEIEAVYNPLPNALHVEWTIKALEAGKHVLCEKPIALNAADCRHMIDAAKANGVILMEAFMYQYTERIKKTREIVASGALGDIKFIDACFRIASPVNTSIKWLPELGGGALYDVGCYPLNFASLFVTEVPLSVSAEATTEGGIDILASVLLRYPSGIIAALHTGFNAVRRVRAEILGTKGALEVPDPFLDNEGELILTDESGVAQIPVPKSDRFRSEIDDVSLAIIEGREPGVSLRQSLQNMEIMDRIWADLARKSA